uniref:Protection of telomeres protein 1 n=1 Tax=Oryzias sinensis TaxID=183150 RepID=A0A8C8DIT8_9TELE
MPFHALVDGASPGVQVPPHLTRIPINLISTSSDLANALVKGKVVRKGPLVSVAPNDFILKAVVQEEDSQPHISTQIPAINIVVFGELARDFSQCVSPGDVVMASGFTVSKSPTASKDKLHHLNLLLSEEDANIYVSSLKIPKLTKAPRYTYTPLGDLKAGSVVNVYGVVVFFKQPFKSHGTDFCSSLKITDKSNHNIGCTIFCEKLEEHPKIFQNGDIVRMHRVKVQLFNNTITLVNTFGFSVVTFDGKPSGSVEPRTSSRTIHFDEEDRRRVEELQTWISSQNILLSSTSSVSLSAVQPKAYFDLTCQLLAKAPVDSTCSLLRVWDGTRCPNTFLKVDVDPNDVEGPTTFSREKESFIASVLVYDNHSEFAKQLKPGAFLRIYNLRAIPVTSKECSVTGSHSEEVEHIVFHLHGGTSYGRGIRVLPENSPDVQMLKRAIAFLTDDVGNCASELNDSELLEVWSTPPESLGMANICRSSFLICRLQLQRVTLSELKQSRPGQVYRVRAQLRSYEPSKLHQALKLFCSKCSSIQEIPDDEWVASIFSEACKNSEDWAPQRTLRVHLSTQLKTEGKANELLFITGTTLEETCRLATGYNNIVPLTSSKSGLVLMDLSAPFLFRGPRRFYGCKQCSEATVRELPSRGDKLLDEKIIAEALGVQLLQFVLLMKLQLQDATDTLDVFLWKHAVSLKCSTLFTQKSHWVVFLEMLRL